MSSKNSTVSLCMVVGLILVVGVIVWYCTKKRKSTFEKGSQKTISNTDTESSIEKFTSLAAGANDNTGHLLDDAYDLIPAPDNEAPAVHFADLVNQGDHLKEFVEQPKSGGESTRPLERLHRIQGKSLMPRTSANVTAFNVDVASPSSPAWMVNTPRVSSALKSKFKDYSMSTLIRGDIPIRYVPAVCLISKTIQGLDDWVGNGLFQPHFQALYNKYTGQEFKNLVQKVAGAGSASGYGGASGGVIMDHN